MTTNPPELLAPSEAAKVLEKALRGKERDFTVADASARSGLPLRDAERGMHALVSEYRGHLRVTHEGELVFRFPYGFTKPWETRTRIEAALRSVGKAAATAGRFIVRAWVAIVLVGYTAIFLAMLIGLTFARSSGGGDDRRRGGGDFGLSWVLLRVVGDALFWTFHPYSPFAVRSAFNEGVTYDARGRRVPVRPKDEKRFYEKVNAFLFGPDRPAPDPRETERKILAELRAQKGRIGLGDVMRVTGLPREEADPLMARLMLDYDGTIEVSEEGGITYQFAAMRKSAAASADPRPDPAWSKPKRLAPITGNPAGTNLAIAALNAFNLLMSWWALSAHITLEKLVMVLRRVPLEKLPPGGTAIALGVVPLVFSLALFALPLVRLAVRRFQARKVARENGRLALLREVLTQAGKEGVPDEALRDAWHAAAGVEPSSEEVTRQVVALGGDVDMESGNGVRYRFPELEAEATALAAEREAAAEDEARLGKIVFTSEA